MESKKISFGFSKIKKKSNILLSTQPEIKEEVEYITSFDKHSLKVSEKKKEFVIPVKNNYSVDERISEKKRKEMETVTEDVSTVNADDEHVSIDQLAIRELLSDTKKTYELPDTSTAAIPMNATVVKASEESANYEEIPVSEFGYAMLRGMGWTRGKGIGKKQKIVDVYVPEFRAHGLGLGADGPPKD